MILKFIYSEKVTKFWEISTLILSYVVPVKGMVGFRKILWPFQNIWILTMIVFNHFYFNYLLYLFDSLFRKCISQKFSLLFLYQTLWHTKQCWTREGIHWINSLFPLLMMFYNFERMRPNSCKVKLKRKSNMLLYTHMAEKNFICFFWLLLGLWTYLHFSKSSFQIIQIWYADDVILNVLKLN